MTLLQWNVGLMDRSVRTLVGLGLIGVAVSGDSDSYAWLGWIGVVPLVTGLTGMCPLYSLLGWNTRGY